MSDNPMCFGSTSIFDKKDKNDQFELSQLANLTSSLECWQLLVLLPVFNLFYI
jgi:hypothetical protein